MVTKQLAQGTIEQFEIEIKFRKLIIKNTTTHSPVQGGVKPHGSGDPRTLIITPMYHL